MAYETSDKAEKFSPRDHPDWIGRLFLVYPTEVNNVVFVDDKGVPSPTDVVTADVAILDLIDPETGKNKVLLGARIAGKAIVPQIKGKVSSGNANLGRLRQLPAQGAKSGAFVFDTEFSGADEAMAKIQDSVDWRGKYGAAPPTGVASPAPATAYQAPPATPGTVASTAAGPWYGTPEGAALLGKLVSNGVANATTFDLATAQLVGASFA